MVSRVKTLFAQLFVVDPEERTKVALLAAIFCFIIAGYAVAKEMKDTVFMAVVGRTYVPTAKMLSLLVTVPAIYFYSKLVDKVRPYHVLMICSLFFGIGGLLFAYFVGHPTIGLVNTNARWDRWFGWLLYFFVEGYSPFLVSVFWAFANTVNDPEAAKDSYGFVVSGSKVGGMISAGLAWALFSWTASLPNPAAYDVFNHQLVFVLASLLILAVPLCIMWLVRSVPKKQLHGYEAAYQLEKQKRKAGKAETGFFSGLKVFIKYPYVLGVFGMVFFYETVATVVGYLRLGEAGVNATSVAGVTSYLFKTIFIMHVVTFFISILGTRALFKTFGVRRSLLLIPASIAIVLMLFLFNMTPTSLIFAYTTLKAINFAFLWPVRETLYIPTVKEIRFKAKSWIDAFGSKFAKTTGATFNHLFVTNMVPAALLPPLTAFFVPIMFLWGVTAYLLGRRYNYAVRHNEVIGHDDAKNCAEKARV